MELLSNLKEGFPFRFACEEGRKTHLKYCETGFVVLDIAFRLNINVMMFIIFSFFSFAALKVVIGTAAFQYSLRNINIREVFILFNILFVGL